ELGAVEHPLPSQHRTTVVGIPNPEPAREFAEDMSDLLELRRKRLRHRQGAVLQRASELVLNLPLRIQVADRLQMLPQLFRPLKTEASGGAVRLCNGDGSKLMGLHDAKTD